MKSRWRVLILAVVFVVALAPGRGRADVADVDCGALPRIGVAELDRYDERFCMAGSQGGLSTGESRRPVGGDIELLVAYNRATFVAVQLFTTNFRTYLELDDVSEYVGGVFSGWEPRNWGAERRHDRFVLVDMEARLSEGAPYLPCVAFLARMKPIGQAPGYRESLTGMYCAMDRLTPTEDEVAAFLAGLRY